MEVSRKTEPFDQPNALMVKTIALLKDRDLFEVYAQTHIPFYWLRQFVAMKFRNPSVNRVQFLYEYLTSTKLI